jgi:hypothetical protein
MFYVQPNTAQTERLKKLYKKVRVLYGDIPPQMAFLGNIDADYLETFINATRRIAAHPHIDPDLFAFIRLYVAHREHYPYCMQFNRRMLLARNYSESELLHAIEDISKIPLDERDRKLALFAIRALYESDRITQQDFDAIYKMGWSQKDTFDAIEHAGTILKNGRILTAYMMKDIS